MSAVAILGIIERLEAVSVLSKSRRVRFITKTITGCYESADRINNAGKDLVASGIPQEKTFVEKEDRQLKVIVPATSEPEILEIHKRLSPSSTTVM